MAWQAKVLTAESGVPHGRLRELTPYCHMHTGVRSLPTNEMLQIQQNTSYLVLYTVCFTEP